jgi:hypothetical protein
VFTQSGSSLTSDVLGAEVQRREFLARRASGKLPAKSNSLRFGLS